MAALGHRYPRSRARSSAGARDFPQRQPEDDCDIIGGTAEDALDGCSSIGSPEDVWGVYTYDVGDQPFALATPDLDQDEFDEIVTANASGSQEEVAPQGGLSVLRNLTQASTQPAEGSYGGFTRLDHQDGLDDFLTYRAQRDVAFGEVNRDCCPDVLSIGGNKAPPLDYKPAVSVIHGRCSPDLGIQYRYGSLSEQVAAVATGELGGDVNTNTGEELPDIVVGNKLNESNIQIWQQQWDGVGERVFVLEQTIPSSGSFPGAVHGVAVADFDKQDFNGQFYDDVALVMGREDGLEVSRVRVYFADGTGSLDTTDFVDIALGSNLQAIAAGDINTNGDIDLVVTDAPNNGSSPDHLYVLTNDGSGGFSASTAIGLAQTGQNNVAEKPVGVVFALLNDDLFPDVATCNSDFDTVSVLLNNSGTLGSPSIYNLATGANPVSIASGRLNEGGSLDLVTANRDTQTMSLLFFDVDGAVVSTATYDADPDPIFVAVSDLNADSLDDIAVLNNGAIDGPVTGMPDTIAAYLNETAAPGTFHDDRRVIMPAGTDPVAITFGNLDGNTKPDLINVVDDAEDTFSQSHIRITWNRCTFEPGDLTFDCIVCGLDIQPFVDCYIPNAPDVVPGCQAADINADGILDETDVECFVDILLNEPNSCVQLCTAQQQGGGDESGMAAQSEQSFSQSELGPSADSELVAAVDEVLAWLDENPKSAYPEMTVAQYVEMLVAVMQEAGVLPEQED